MSLVRRAPRVVAAIASVIPFLVTYEAMTERLQPDVRRLMEMPQMRVLLAYGVAFSTTGDAVTAIVALAAVLAASDTSPTKFFTQLTQLPPDADDE
jgi:hypothetical protein